MDSGSATERRTTVAIGALLIIVGVVFLVGQQLAIDWGASGWPLFIIVPGLILFALAVAVGGRSGAAFAVPAGIVTMTGVVLAVQNATDLWATWAYAWALVAPGGVGLGLFAYGILAGQRDLIEAGGRTLLVGLGLFLGFGFFFEAILHLSGDQLAGLDGVFAIGLIALGVIFVALSVVTRRPPIEG